MSDTLSRLPGISAARAPISRPSQDRAGFSWSYTRIIRVFELALSGSMIVGGIALLWHGYQVLTGSQGPLQFMKWLADQPEPGFIQLLLTPHAGMQLLRYSGAQAVVTAGSLARLVVGAALLVTGLDGVLRTIQGR